MRMLVTLLGIAIAGFTALGQEQPSRLRLPVWTFHAKHTTTVGVNLGLASTLSDTPRHVTTIGVHAEAIGFGVLLLLAPREGTARDSAGFAAKWKVAPSERIHGISASPLGSVCDCMVQGISLNGGGLYARSVNGLSAAFALNEVDLHRGVQLAGLSLFAYRSVGLQAAFLSTSARELYGLQVAAINLSGRATGVQIGIFNKSVHLRGLQIGIWNVNQKRKLPLFNWA